MKVKKYDGSLHDEGARDGGVYLYVPSLGYSISMAELLMDFIGKPLLIEEKQLKTKKKIVITVSTKGRTS